MVKELSKEIITKVIEEDSGTHRYVLERIWDDKQPIVTVITLYPSSSELVITDTTTMLVTNNVYKLGFGGFISVNLYSKIHFPDSPTKKDRARNYKTATNKTNDEYILESCKKADEIIIAVGSLPSKNKLVAQRLQSILTTLKEEGLLDKTKSLIDQEKQVLCHPLAPKARNSWTLKNSPI